VPQLGRHARLAPQQSAVGGQLLSRWLSSAARSCRQGPGQLTGGQPAPSAPYFIAEADESDGTLSQFRPIMPSS